MALSPIKGPPRRFPFAVYDLEWYPQNYGLRLIGTRTHFGYAPIWAREPNRDDALARFIEYATAPEWSGTYWFGHWAGTSDIIFLFPFLGALCEKKHYEAKATLVGSSVQTLKIEDPASGRHWIFADSAFLLRDSLRKVGKAVGMSKGGAEGDTEIFEAADPVLEEYNRQDCEILWVALNRFRDEIESMGGEMRPTIASTSLSLFRRKFLSETISVSAEVNRRARLAYTGSRVEPFAEFCSNANYYDINSSFPSSMRRPLPGNVERETKKPRDGEIYLARCKVSVGKSNVIPPLPLRAKGRVFFPVGQWESWYMHEDVDFARSIGADIKVKEAIVFRPNHDFGRFAEYVYAKRKSDPDEFRTWLWKLIGNSGYGKLAERCDKESVQFDVPLFCPHVPEHPEGECRSIFAPGWIQCMDDVDVPHEVVPMAATITAHARATLGKYLIQDGHPYYCDTDGFAVDSLFPTGDALGELKLEKIIAKGQFLAPKLYRLETTDGKTIIAAKGFDKRSMTDARFQELSNGGKLTITRMGRLKEIYGLSSPNRHPRDVLVQKGVPGRSADPKRRNTAQLPKRAPDGSYTRPWSYDELVDRIGADMR